MPKSKFKIQKLLIIAFLVFLLFFLAPSPAFAETCTWCGQDVDDPETPKVNETKPCPRPLVPCGQSCDLSGTLQIEDTPCGFCHIFVLIDNIVDFALFKIVLPIAALMFIIGGFYLLIASGKPELFSRAKSILTAAVVGLVIMFVAFIFIGTFLQMIGLAEWTTDIYENWWKEGFFQFPCH